jgi:hypothetical protein
MCGRVCSRTDRRSVSGAIPCARDSADASRKHHAALARVLENIFLWSGPSTWLTSVMFATLRQIRVETGPVALAFGDALTFVAAIQENKGLHP